MSLGVRRGNGTKIEQIKILKQYIKGVLDKADHHAENVNEVILTLIGAVIWKKDEDAIEVMTQSGDMKNVLWVKINNTRYAFSYNHETEKIEMRKHSIKGDVVKSFDNSIFAKEVKEIFESL